MESVLKNEKLTEAVCLFPCLWQVNTKSYKDAVAKANENSHVAGVAAKISLVQNLLCLIRLLFRRNKAKRSSVSSYSSSLETFIFSSTCLNFTNYARALRLIRIHVVQTLNCERSSATPLRPTLTLRRS